MELNPTEGNVFALVDEIKFREHIDDVFHAIFAKQLEKENHGEILITAPHDYACMRTVHRYLDEECDGIMSSEYALQYNKYVIDFCETTPRDEQSLIDGIIHLVCGVNLGIKS